MHHRAQYAVVAAVSLFVAIPQQPAAPRKLGAPTAALEQEFTGIDFVRELRDGRLLVFDAKDKAIHAINLTTKSGTKIGREGDGPGEFRIPMKLFNLGGDSLGFTDMARGSKLMVVTPAGELGGFLNLVDSALSTRGFNATASDDAGRLYAVETKNPFIDSMTIVRWDRARGRRDTIAKYMGAPVSPLFKQAPEVREMPGGGYAYRPGPVMPFVTYDQWAVAGDGRIALVEAAPYRVTMVNVNGTRVRGSVMSYQPIPVGDGEKAVFKADMVRPRAFVGYNRNGGGNTYGFRTGTFEEPPEWPPTLPAFPQQALQFASDGMLWVLRSVKAGTPLTYDVFDAAAKLAYQLELPPKTKVVGFGKGVVYLARVDDDDLHYLERYALIPTRPVRP